MGNGAKKKARTGFVQALAVSTFIESNEARL
jgi:hypothetical protein